MRVYITMNVIKDSGLRILQDVAVAGFIHWAWLLKEISRLVDVDRCHRVVDEQRQIPCLDGG